MTISRDDRPFLYRSADSYGMCVIISMPLTIQSHDTLILCHDREHDWPRALYTNKIISRTIFRELFESIFIFLELFM